MQASKLLLVPKDLFLGQNCVFSLTLNHPFTQQGPSHHGVTGAETNPLCFQDFLMILLLLA
jgi:hypothetical protein